MFGAILHLKWHVTYTKNGILYFLKEEDDTRHKRVWTQRKDNALKFDNQPVAEIKINEIKEMFQNKKMNIKAVC